MKLSDLANRIMPVTDDGRWAEEALDNNDSQHTRRAYIRSVFTLIEGTIWVLKQTILKSLEEINAINKLQPGEREILCDTTYELKNNGQIKEQTKYLKITDNMKFTYSILQKHAGIKVKLEPGSKEWENFTTALTMRNRITHPRIVSDLHISDQDILICRSVSSWYNSLLFKTINELYQLEKF